MTLKQDMIINGLDLDFFTFPQMPSRLTLSAAAVDEFEYSADASVVHEDIRA